MTADSVLNAYLLGSISHRSFSQLQRRLAYEISGDLDSGALILCEHPHSVTIGREGSRKHLRGSGPHPRWVARGGGTMMYAPGQVIIAPVLSLHQHRVTPAAFRNELQRIVLGIVRNFNVDSRLDSRPGLFVGDRLLAHVGLAIRSGITNFGITLNVNPDLEPFRTIHVDGHTRPMTSLTRESPLRVRAAAVRQQLVEAIASRFGFDHFNVFHHHPALAVQQPHDENAAAR